MVQKGKLDLISVELLTLIYMGVTLLMTLIYWNGLENPVGMVMLRVVVLAVMAVTQLTHRFMSKKLALAWRTFPLLLCLIWWYPETYDFCSQLPYKDHVFAAIDQTLFGCQPALEFDKVLSSAFWSEAFNMGYYAYYYMMMSVIVFYLIFRMREFDKATFIFLGSFFLFYLIYELLPVAGPQYYFCALGNIYGDGGWGNSFPDLGHYFKEHTEMLTPDIKGIFSQLVIGAQEVGERPTAAFPSSHVGMSTVSMLLAWRSGNKWLFWIMVPFYVLLCCGTVYIKAHYLIDSIAGFFFALLFYYLTNRVYPIVMRK